MSRLRERAAKPSHSGECAYTAPCRLVCQNEGEGSEWQNPRILANAPTPPCRLVCQNENDGSSTCSAGPDSRWNHRAGTMSRFRERAAKPSHSGECAYTAPCRLVCQNENDGSSTCSVGPDSRWHRRAGTGMSRLRERVAKPSHSGECAYAAPCRLVCQNEGDGASGRTLAFWRMRLHRAL